jgi:hypothetical protein
MSTTAPLDDVLAKITTDRLVLTLSKQLAARVENLESRGQDSQEGGKEVSAAIPISDPQPAGKFAAHGTSTDESPVSNTCRFCKICDVCRCPPYGHRFVEGTSETVELTLEFLADNKKNWLIGFMSLEL